MKPHEAWLYKAENDLKSARKLIENEPVLLDTAIYHTQQCAEKALKAYLAFKQQPVQRTHDVALLVELCADKVVSDGVAAMKISDRGVV